MRARAGPVVRGLIMGLWLALAGVSDALIVPAARVNGELITLDLVDRQFEELLRERRLNIARMNNPAKAKEMKREVLDNLIRVELLWQEAKAAGLVAADDEVDRAVGQVRGRHRTHEAYVARLESSGFNERSYRVYTRKMLSGDRYAQRIVDRDVQVTEQDIDQFYEINPRLFKRAQQVKVRQILIAVPDNATPEQKGEARRRIEALLARARAGESFDELARQNSDDATRQWGGELDPFGRGEKARPFEDAAFALAPGAISDVVETGAGLHVIKLEQQLPETVVPLDSVRTRIAEHLKQSRGQEAVAKEVEQLRALGKVEVLTPL